MKPGQGRQNPIIFFDGDCGMCTASVSVIIRADRGGKFLFAPLQGTTARALLPPLPADPGQWSMLYLDESGVHSQSDAILEIYRRLGGAWRLLTLLRLIPRRLRDPVYRVIASHRYHWFGKHETCRVPTVEERGRFLP